MPPCATWTPRRRCPAFSWRLRMLTPLTTTLCFSGMVRRISPCLPLSLPAMTITGSPGASSSQWRLVCCLFFSTGLQDLRGERDDLHEVPLAKLARDRPEDAGSARVVGGREQDGGVLVEADERAVRPLVFLVDPNHHGLHHLALLDLPAGLGGLDGGRDDVAHVGVFAVVAAGDADDQELLLASAPPLGLGVGFDLGGLFGRLFLGVGLRLRHGDGAQRLWLGRGTEAEVALAQHGHDAGDVVPDFGDLARVLQLADRMLEPELVQLPARRAQAHAQLVRLEDPELVDLHLWPPASAALITRVFIGSLAAASFIASLATCGVTPPISNSTRPGLTTATQPSGFPLPEPIRVSAGFLVIDLSGKTRIQIWPPRLTCRVIARRAASICRLLIQHASIACRP